MKKGGLFRTRSHGQLCSLELLTTNYCGVIRIQTDDLPAIGGNLKQMHQYKVLDVIDGLRIPVELQHTTASYMAIAGVM